MFRLLGVLVLTYTLYAAASGVVHAKAGISSRRVLRKESSAYFWAVIAIYTALGVALMTLF